MTQRFGLTIRAMRRGWQLTLREVEERSRALAGEKARRYPEISASWLSRLESDEHELTISKLIALADIFAVTPQRLLSLANASSTLSTPVRHPPNLLPWQLGERPQNVTIALSDFAPTNAMLLSMATDGPARSRYIRAIVGAGDHTLEPMIPPGSIVQIDTKERAILPRKKWEHEFRRPIYALRSADGYVCGWCELSKDGDWLTLIPHPLSTASSQRWKYPEEIQSIGRIVAAAIHFSG